MDCRHVQRNMSAWLDGEMDAVRHDAFFDHIADCEACRELVGEASYMEAALAGALKRRMTAPASIRYNVLSAISRTANQRQPVRRGFAWRPAAAMAAVLALGSAGWRTFTEALEPAPTTQAEAQPSPPRTASVPPAAEKPASSPARVPASPSPRRLAAAPAPKPAEPRAASPERARPSAERPAPRPETRPVAGKPLAAAAPAPKPKAPVPEPPVGRVMAITGTGDPVLARFLTRREGMAAWKDASRTLHANAHLQSGDDTIVTMALNDGTTLKSNQHTEFVVLRSPSKDEPSWGIRLVRGELWIQSQSPVKVTTPSMEIRAEQAEFTVRSTDGESAAVMAVAGQVTATNSMGSAEVSAGQATSASSGAAPEAAFPLANPRGQLDWAYTPPSNP